MKDNEHIIDNEFLARYPTAYRNEYGKLVCDICITNKYGHTIRSRLGECLKVNKFYIYTIMWKELSPEMRKEYLRKC